VALQTRKDLHSFHNPTIQPDEELAKRGFSMYKGQQDVRWGGSTLSVCLSSVLKRWHQCIALNMIGFWTFPSSIIPNKTQHFGYWIRFHPGWKSGEVDILLCAVTDPPELSPMFSLPEDGNRSSFWNTVSCLEILSNG
jgi:hypothetical protein